jgi:hypothetical protein
MEGIVGTNDDNVSDAAGAASDMLKERDRLRELNRFLVLQQNMERGRSAEVCTCVLNHGGYTAMGNHWSDCKSSSHG